MNKIKLEDIEFVYNTPSYLLDTVEILCNEILEFEANNKSNIIFNKKCYFIVMCAVSIEAHLNWYYYFDKKIDVSTNEHSKYPTDDKIKNSPLNGSTKGAVRAIFKLRNEMVHPKYKPRNGFDQYNYNSNFVLLSFSTLVDVCEELLKACPITLKGRFALTPKQKQLSFSAKKIKLKDISGKGINWVQAINEYKVSLPIPNIGHIEKEGIFPNKPSSIDKRKR